MDYIKNRSRSFDTTFYVRALPNEYLVRVGKKKLDISLGGSAFRLFNKHLKVPASAEITQFELECSTSNYLGVIVKGYVAWRINPEDVEKAIRSLDFYNIDNPLEKTSDLIRDMAKDAVRRSIADIKVDEILNSGDRLKVSIEKILENVSKWGLLVETIGIHKIFIKSENVYNELQAEERNKIRLQAELSNQKTSTNIEQGEIEQQKSLQKQKSELLKIEIEESTKQKQMRQEAEIEEIRLEKEKDKQNIELSRHIETERYDYEKERLSHEHDLQKSANEIKEGKLKLLERKKEISGSLSDRELAQLLISRLEKVSGIYKNANLTVFGDGAETAGSLLAPVEVLTGFIKNYLAGNQPDKKSQKNGE